MEFELDKKVLEELKPYFADAKSWEVDDISAIPELRKWLLEGRAQPKLSGELACVKIEDREIPNVFGENSASKVRIYFPEKSNGETSLIVFFRGSGFIIGKAWQYDLICAELCVTTNSVVVSADYRLAPEYRYPAAIEDCYSTLVWADAHRGELGAAKKKLALVGASAGGGMAVSAALMARDSHGPTIDILLPLYPMLDPLNSGRSNHTIIDSRVWDGAKNGKGWQAYLGDRLNDVRLTYKAAPTMAESYTGLPPVFTFIGELDALQDEMFIFVRRLANDGVPVEFHYFPNCFHAFEINWPNAEISHRARRMIAEAINSAFDEGE